MRVDELSADEVALVQKHRDAEAAKKAAIDFHRKAIFTAHEFEEWSARTGEGLTFSTFINTFGYQGKDGKQIYDAVQRISETAWPQKSGY